MDAHAAIASVNPQISLLNDHPDTELSVALDADAGIDADRVLELESGLPTVLLIDFSNPRLLDRLEPVLPPLWVPRRACRAVPRYHRQHVPRA